MVNDFDWNSVDFFRRCTEQNKLAQKNSFRFARVSSLEGFQDLLGQLTSAKAVVAASDVSQGYVSTTNSPATRRVKVVFIAMRHRIDDMTARDRCLNIMRELFRQFMTKLVLEKTQLADESIYLDDNISFNEIDKYFFSGMACAWFSVGVTTYTDLRYNSDDWDND
jgi:hypothetical protein